MSKQIKTKKIQFNSLLFGLLIMSCTYCFAQVTIDPTSIGKMGLINASLATQLIENAAIVRNNKTAERKLRETLKLNYGKNIYDHSSVTGFSLTKQAVKTIATKVIVNVLGSDENVPYYSKTKKEYIEKMNKLSVDNLAIPTVDYNEMTHSNRQQFYQIRRAIIAEDAKRGQRSRGLLKITAAYLAIVSAPELIKTLNAFETLD